MKDFIKSFNVTRTVFSLLSIVCMIMIFMFSCENGPESADTSGNITEIVAETIVADFDELPQAEKSDILSTIDHYVRKTAHFSIYTLWGFCVSFAIGKRKLLSKGSALNTGICFIYACSDEIHQYFVPERSCQFTDVLIDTSGSIAGMLFSFIIMLLISAIIKRKQKKKGSL